MAEDFYSLLEVPEDATQAEIKAAFREKVQEYHPDHNDDPRATAQFTALKTAYDTLGDPTERQSYDRLGHRDYVAKRTDGLPDPEKWAPSRAEDRASAASTDATGAEERDVASGGSGGSEQSGSRSPSGATDSGSEADPASADGRATAAGGSSSDGPSGSPSSSRHGRAASNEAGTGSDASGRTRNASSTSGRSGTNSSSGTDRSSSGSATRRSSSSPSGGSSGTRRPGTGGSGRSSSGRETGGSRQRPASDGAGTATRRDAVASWIADNAVARRLVGWPLLWVVALTYASGLVAFAVEYAEALTAVATRVASAGTDAEALAAAFDRAAVPTLVDALATPLSAPESATTVALAGATLVGLGAIVLPSVTFLLVYLTRGTPGWTPTYLYVAAALGPLAALVGGAVTSIPVLAALGLVAVCPALAVAGMLFSAFLRPKLVSRVRH